MDKFINTIGRQYGSGGREIGEKLAHELGIHYYDTMLLDKVAENANLSPALIAQYDEKLADIRRPFTFASALTPFTGEKDTKRLPFPIQAALAQFEEIAKIGQGESAVIVGRCADYVLREQGNVLSVFIHAERAHRIDRVARRNQINQSAADKRIRQTDKLRASYYEFYTEKIWGAAESYDVCLDSGVFGIAGSVQFLKNSVQLFTERGTGNK